MIKYFTGIDAARLAGWICFISMFVFLSCDDWLDEDNDDDKPTFSYGTFASDLDTPWEMVFSGDGRMFATERPGRVVVISAGKVEQWLKMDSVVQEVGESGLLGIALDPDFSDNHYLYLGYTYAASKGPLKLVNKLVRYKESDGKPVFDKVLLDGIEGNYIHNGGSLEFGPDGMLYWGMGERYVPELAQSLDVLNGKILRLTRDGLVPADNPFPGSYVYSYGHRNPQGLAFHPDTHDLWSTEHGPSDEQGCCLDEINRIEAGKNYGWPVIRGNTQQAGMVTPEWISGDTTTWAPTGGYFITQGAWNRSFVFTGLRGQALYRAVFDDAAAKIIRVERYLYRYFGRMRNIVQGPDGLLYVSISNEDGRGNPSGVDDRIIKVSVEQLARLTPDRVYER